MVPAGQVEVAQPELSAMTVSLTVGALTQLSVGGGTQVRLPVATGPVAESRYPACDESPSSSFGKVIDPSEILLVVTAPAAIATPVFSEMA